ncbi:MAG TPA: Hint domain-containing protein, partial [Candidatus Limnocylindrales bacterium]|nr:Hint domain-containing protein [Candidatus Limnocylindrales bacterium]
TYTIFDTTYAFGQGVNVVNLTTTPSNVHVGDSFRINATIVNDSPNIIFFSGGCQSPLTAIFDANVEINQEIGCYAISNNALRPEQNVTVSGPSSGTIYTASSVGRTNANVTFSYESGNSTYLSSSAFSFTTSEKVSSQNSDHVYIRFSNLTSSNGFTLISGWNLSNPKGNLVLLSIEHGNIKREILHFTPASSSCYYYQSECTDGIITYSGSSRFLNGSTIHLEIDKQSKKLLLSTDFAQLVFSLDTLRGWSQNQQNMTNQVVLKENQTEGPLLVQKILSNTVTGLLFRSYPVASNVGSPVTLYVGDTVSNGCNIQLTLVKINDNEAIFAKKEAPNKPCPICLSGYTMISTPNGPVNVKELRNGMVVWTMDNLAHRKTAVILETGKTEVGNSHKMVHLILDDRRELYVSPNHPTADGRLFGHLRTGDSLDGAIVRTAVIVPYNETFTYDILPSGQTGYYWANGILAASTLKH